MVRIQLTKKQQEDMLELINRGFAYMDTHSYRDWKKMERLRDIFKQGNIG